MNQSSLPHGTQTNTKSTAPHNTPFVVRLLALCLSLWAAFTAIMLLWKPIFIMTMNAYSLADFVYLPQIIAAGFSMDVATATYLTAPVVLWAIARIWTRGTKTLRGMNTALTIWLWCATVIMTAIYCFDLVLFPYWGFRIDSTPVFYLFSSPSAAMASVSWWQIPVILAATGAVAFSTGKLITLISKRLTPAQTPLSTKQRVWATIIMTLVAAAAIIPLRGGITVSTMSPGRAYFSHDMRLNNAAINPVFNFLYSLSHTDNLAEQFQSLPAQQANEIVNEMCRQRPATEITAADSAMANIGLTSPTPDIYLIILESFSSHLLPSQGGQGVAINLDKIASGGILFTNFYAESFRTDRALPAILAGYPAQPTTSLLRYIPKFRNIPTLATALKQRGYTTNYYYGGDLDFTNLRAFLITGGFDNLTGDTHFPVSQRLSKWGVHDGPLFDRVVSDLTTGGSNSTHSKPRFTVIQTSSSHEPYDVPSNILANKRANAFAYADAQLGRFINALKENGQWDNALIIIVPDHWGSYPEDLSEPLARHHVPLVFAGGALASAPMQIERAGSQSAIAGTLMAMLDRASASAPNGKNLFPFSRNMLAPGYKPWAWIAEPQFMGIIEPQGATIINTQNYAPVNSASMNPEPSANQVKAFVQCLYLDLDKR